MELSIYNIKGEVTDKKVTLDDSIFGIELHGLLVDSIHFDVSIVGNHGHSLEILMRSLSPHFLGCFGE